MSNVHNVRVDRIKEIAAQNGLQMKYLCSLIGKRSSFLVDVKNGKDHIDTNELSIIADKLNTTVEYLTGQTDDPAKPAEKEKPDAITDAKQAEFDARFMRLSPDRRDFVLQFLELALAEQEKGKDVRQPPKRPE